MIDTTNHETVFEQKMKELDELYRDFHRKRIDKDSEGAKEKIKKIEKEINNIVYIILTSEEEITWHYFRIVLYYSHDEGEKNDCIQVTS